MAYFKASKVREKRAKKPIAGGVMAPSAGLRIWYQGQLLDLADVMLNDYASEIAAELKNSAVQKFFATDASAASILKSLMARLFTKWERVFGNAASKLSKEFVDKSDGYAKASAFNSLSIAGIEQPIHAYNENVNATLGAYQTYNHTLITGIHADVHEKIYTAVMLSLTSPNPEEQGTSGILNALNSVGGFTRKRAELIARDQTSKLYASLSDKRLEENGVEEFEWLHSAAGKEPRESHELMDGHIFKLNDPRMWTVGGEFHLKKGDLGPPGWAIRCRCKKRPVIFKYAD